jgi:tRNA modification GTPase
LGYLNYSFIVGNSFLENHLKAMSSLVLHETIAAIATAVVPQQGSVGIVRLSGTESIAIAKQLFIPVGKQVWQSHQILYGHVYQGEKVLDECLLLLMQAPRSFTREDVVEFHCHGGIIAVQQVLQECLTLGARLAQPGEFTLRAFLNGRIDLAQAESIQDLVGAKSAQAAELAIAQLQGKLSHPIKKLREQCLDILAEIEARIDFEEDLPPLDVRKIKLEIAEINQIANQMLETAKGGELLRQGLKVAIVGKPNVGKSSLLNAWSQSDRAIVTDLPGTTRDVVDSHLVVGGIPIQVLDTAGIRASDDLVEKLGVERSLVAAAQADLILFTIDAQQGWGEAEQEILASFGDRPTILVINKIDLAPTISPILDREFAAIVKTSAINAQGIEDLETAILKCVGQNSLSAANLNIAINQRQAACLLRTIQSLAKVEITIGDRLPLDFWTIDLRDALAALGEITGEEVTESVLNRIFSRFCIGK